MNWQTLLVISLLGLSAIFATGLSVFAWRRRTLMIWAWPFALMTASLAFWSLTYAIEFVFPLLEAKTVAAKFQYIGIAFVPIGWFLFAMAYSGRERWLASSRVALLSLVPLVAILLAFTNEAHRLFWARISLNTNGPLAVFDADYGPAWWVFFAYAYALLLIGSIAIFLALRNFNAAYRWQLITLLASPILPWVGNALYIARISPVPQLDTGPFAFTISALILAIGIFRLRIFDLAPMARSAVFEAMQSAALVIDRKERIVDINSAARELLITEAGDPVGRDANEAVNSWGQISALLPDSGPTQAELMLERGSLTHYYNLQVTPIHNSRGQPRGRLLLLTDITAEKIAEEAQAMAQVRAELLAKVGHELRTPLNAILGMAEMIDYGVYGEVSEKQSAAIQNIIERTHHLTRLINDLLLQTQIEAGEFRLYDEPFSPYELVKRVGKTLRPLAQIKDLSYRARVDASMPNLLNGDPDRITQIMLNLVENAIKFTDHGEVNLHITPDGSHWSIQVSDTGIGIPIEVQSKLFQAFEQANYKITRETGGFGLGLSIVRELATIMGGKVELESAEGIGSKITVTLPLEPVEETAQ